MASNQHWIFHRHPDYLAREEAWRTIADVFAGDSVALSPENRERYLPRGRIGEIPELYSLRVQHAHLPSWVADAVEAIVGTILSQPPAEIQLDALGDPTSPSSPHWLWFNARDRKRRGDAEWTALALSHLVLFKKAIALIDTNANTETLATVRNERQARQAGIRAYANLIHPLNFVNWRTGPTGHIVEALIREVQDERASLADTEGAATETYLRVTAEGWERYRVRDHGSRVELVATGKWGRRFVASDGTPIPPIAVVERTGHERDSIYDLAKLSIQYMRIASLIDEDYQRHTLRILLVPGSEEAAQLVADELKRGALVLASQPLPTGDGQTIQWLESSNTTTASGLARLESIERQAASRVTQAFPEVADRIALTSGVSVDRQFTQKAGPKLADYATLVEEIENESLWLYAQAVGINDPHGKIWILRPKHFDLRSPVQKFEEKKQSLRDLPLPISVHAQLVLDGIRAAGYAEGVDDETLMTEIAAAIDEKRAAESFLGSVAAFGGGDE